MKVLVSDSSILIEFSKRELLDKMFHLELQFAVPDLLFHEELIDLGAYSRQDLLDFGLRVESLDAEGVEAAIAYQSERPALSLVDSFALAVAANEGGTSLPKTGPCAASRTLRASHTWTRCGSSITCLLAAFYRPRRWWLCLRQCVTIPDVRFPNLSWLFVSGD